MATFSDSVLQWAQIDDFSPGIRSRSRKVVAGTAIPAPLGSAQVTNTYSCISLPTGGLAPLPKMNGTFDAPTPAADASTSTGYFNIDGFYAFGPLGPPAANPSGTVDDFFLAVEYLNVDGAHRNFTLYRIDAIVTPAINDNLVAIASTQAPTSEAYVAVQFTTSRMNPTVPYLTPGNPVVVMSWSPPGFAADRHVWAFPNPVAPGTTNIENIALGTTTYSGRVLGHQGRVLVLNDNTYQFGANSGDAVPSNEQLYFSDPANSYQGVTTINPTAGPAEVFMQEYPNGYGCFGSISVGELFLVKHQGGGVRVSGDVANPTVTRLPGVTSSGGLGCIGASTPLGFIYVTRYNGAWLWRGADVSTKISDQLEDDFFVATGQDKLLSFGVQVQEWGDWAVVSNGYLLDTNTQSWWRLDDPSIYTPQWFARSFFAENLYAVPLRYNNTSKAGLIRRYSRQVPASTYSWQGHPIPVSVDRIIQVGQIVLVAEGSGTVAVSLTALDGSTVTETFTITNATQPQRLRITTNAQGYNIVVRIVSTATSTGPAPLVHSLALGYQVQQEAVAA